MIFNNPLFLFAFLALLIPIIIHLFNFRKYVKVDFSNIKFLREALQESRSRNKLKHLLILLSRLFTIASLVMAFAQPIIPTKNKHTLGGKNFVGIWIDNSFSMNAEGKEGILLENAKQKAIEIVKSFNPTDFFQILDNNISSISHRFLTQEEAIEVLNDISFSSEIKTIPEVVRSFDEISRKMYDVRKYYFFLSDFQKTTIDLENIQQDTANVYNFVYLQNIQNSNLFIDSCWFENPVHSLFQNENLKVRIKNFGSNSYENLPVKLFINGKQKALASFSVMPNSETEVTLSYFNDEVGFMDCYVEINDYPVSFDDKFYFSYRIINKFNILQVYEGKENVYIKNLFSKDTTVNYISQTIEKVNYSDFPIFNLIILSNLNEISTGLAFELKEYIKNGGTVLIFPGENISITSYNEFLESLPTPIYLNIDTSKTRVARIDLAHNLFKNIFEYIPENMELPVVFKHYPISNLKNLPADHLMILENGNPFLTLHRIDKGLIYLCSAPLNDKSTNFPLQAIFVPTIHKILLSGNYQTEIFQFISKNNVFVVKNKGISGDKVLKMKKTNADAEFIPLNKNNKTEILLTIYNETIEAGSYYVKNEDSIIDIISLNYDRKESKLAFYSEKDIEEILKKNQIKNYNILDIPVGIMMKTVTELYEGKKLWKIFIILALVFLAIEVLLVRFWR